MKSTLIAMKLAKFMMILLATVVLCGAFTASDGWAETRSITVDGMASLQDNPAISRDNAIKDGLRKAVEQAVGVMMASETLVENAELVRDNIYSKSQGYIKNYNIVKETLGQNVYLVTIQADIGVSDLKNDLGAIGLLQARIGKPRILFMIAERRIGRETPLYWWSGGNGSLAEGSATSETAMKEEFLNKEFNVVDVRPSTGKIENSSIRNDGQSDSGARDAGRKTGAEIVVKGSAGVKEGPRASGSSVGSYMADITATAIRVDNGQVLASGRSHGVARHVAQETGENTALEIAGRDLGRKLIDQIIVKWGVETSGTQMTQITIRGLNGMRDLHKIKEFLSMQVRGVQDIIQRSYEGSLAIIDVYAKANAQQIGDDFTLKKLPDFIFNVTRATANTLEIVVSSAVTAPVAR